MAPYKQAEKGCQVKLLYCSSYHCHLERMELELFNELGITFFSTGKFMDPRKPRMNCLSDPLDIDQSPEVTRFLQLNPKQAIWQVPKIDQNFADRFDVVMVGHCGPAKNYLNRLWPVIKNKIVIYRSYGLQDETQELFFRQCKRENSRFYLVRFSENEKIIKNYSGIDAAILPWIDEERYSGWTGVEPKVFTCQNWWESRYHMDNYSLYEDIVAPFDHLICGIQAPGGLLTPSAQREQFRNSRVYFSLGTRPSPITINAFEAMMTGAPIVTWAHKYGATPGLDMYQMPALIENYVSGLCSDSPAELQSFIRRCIEDGEYAATIGAAARAAALKTFSKAAIKPLWETFFKDKGML